MKTWIRNRITIIKAFFVELFKSELTKKFEQYEKISRDITEMPSEGPEITHKSINALDFVLYLHIEGNQIKTKVYAETQSEPEVNGLKRIDLCNKYLELRVLLRKRFPQFFPADQTSPEVLESLT